jgi:hypothetical protein
MSLGGGIGAVVGGALGFFIGGPAGIFYGAAIGTSVGMMIDPLKPESANSQDPVKFEVTSNEIGKTIPDALGTVKLTGLFMFYGNEHADAQYQSVSGGKGGGGGDKQLTGYKYYMSFAEGLCKGPVDTLYTIYRDNDVVVWQGVVTRPASGGHATLSIADYGSIDFYFGTDDQVANSTAGGIVGSTYNTPFKGLCWAFFNDYYIGDYNRCPTFSFVMRRAPVLPFAALGVIDKYDYNPAHAIWYVLASMSGLPESWLSSSDFAAAATTLLNESRGVSILMDNQQTVLSWIENINNHVNGIVRYQNDGMFHPKLLRADYTPASLPGVTEAIYTDEPSVVRKSWIDTQNEIIAQYSQISGREPGVRAGNLYGIGVPVSNTTVVKGTTVGDIARIGADGDWVWADAMNGYYESHIMAIKSNGTLWAGGCNDSGQLGLGDGTTPSAMTQVGSDADWVKCYCLGYRSFAIKSDGTLYATGNNSYGNLGMGNATGLSSFTKVPVAAGWQKLCGSAGKWAFRTYALASDGSIWVSGVESQTFIPVTAASGFVAVDLSFSTGDSWGFVTDQGRLFINMTEILAGQNFSKLSGGDRHWHAIKQDGTLWSISMGLTVITRVGTATDWVDVSDNLNDLGGSSPGQTGSAYVKNSAGDLYRVDMSGNLTLLDDTMCWSLIAGPKSAGLRPFVGIAS